MKHRENLRSERLPDRALAAQRRLSTGWRGLRQVLASLWLVLFAVAAARAENPFFAMDTGIRGEPGEVAATLAELGYAGLGGSVGQIAPLRQVLEARGLRFFNAYTTLKLYEGAPALTAQLRQAIDELAGRHSALWLAIHSITDGAGQPIAKSSPDGDIIAETALREIAAYAAPKGVQLSLYPHTNFWLERCDDAVRVATRAGHEIVGVTFNLCHWLRVEGDRDPAPILKSALPRLQFVTINGADSGETQGMGWDRLIQPLDAGSYDVRRLLRLLETIGYGGPIGLQAFGIKGDQRENLRRSMGAWRRMKEATP